MTIDSGEILFSLPTINDGLPNDFSDVKVSSETVVIHEDDWRQFEFVDPFHRDKIRAEIEDIDRIWKTQSVPAQDFTAFRAIHVRSRIPVALDQSFSLAEFQKLFAGECCSFTFHNCPQVLSNIVAIRQGGFAFYAQIYENRLYALGIHREVEPHVEAKVADAIASWMRNHGLVLIHWPSRSVVDSPERMGAYLQGQ